MAEILLVPREKIPDIWTKAAPLLDKAISRSSGRYHIVDILTSVLDGSQSLWLAMDGENILGVGTLSINKFPAGAMVGRIEFIGGSDRDEWFEGMWNTMCDYATDYGCGIMETLCRPGIGPYIEKYGGRRTALFYECDLTKRNKTNG